LGAVGTLALNLNLDLALALAPAPVIRVRLRARAIIWEFNFRKWYKLQVSNYPVTP